jgi:sec-independent protein translocase protein TatC
VLPGLYAQERKMSRIFVSVAGPLFLAGVALGYLTLPLALEVLIGFNPEGVTNLIDFNDYLQFFTRTLFVFGLAFNIPVFVVLLNFAGVVKGASLKAYRPWIIIGTFVFAAVATPSADPFTMTLMAGPMVLLFFASEAIARFNDRRRARNAPNAGLSPDELSSI